jgi:hypothetical protein
MSESTATPFTRKREAAIIGFTGPGLAVTQSVMGQAPDNLLFDLNYVLIRHRSRYCAIDADGYGFPAGRREMQ